MTMDRASRERARARAVLHPHNASRATAEVFVKSSGSRENGPVLCKIHAVCARRHPLRRLHRGLPRESAASRAADLRRARGVRRRVHLLKRAGRLHQMALAVEAFTLSKLRSATLAAVWAQSDLDRDARLNRVEFRLALHLVVHVLRASISSTAERSRCCRACRARSSTRCARRRRCRARHRWRTHSRRRSRSRLAAERGARGVSTVGVEDPFAATAPAAAPAPEASFAAKAKREGSFRKDPFKERDAAEPSASLQALHDQRSSMLAMLSRATDYDDDSLGDDDDDDEAAAFSGAGGAEHGEVALLPQGPVQGRTRRRRAGAVGVAAGAPRSAQQHVGNARARHRVRRRR